MRKRHAVALIAAVCMAATGGLVYADPFADTDATTPASTASPVVTLPTGDRIQVPPHGPLIRLDTDTGMRISRLANGDRVAIPLESLPQVRSGDSDERLYNVDALLREGRPDARDVSDPSTLGEPFMDDGESDAKGNTEITIKGTWVDGSTPQAVSGTWINLDTGDSGGVSGDGGTGSVSLPPGDYGFVLDMINAADSSVDIVVTTAELTVTDQAATIDMDGERAKPLGFTVDAEDAQAQAHDLTTFVGDRSGGEPEAYLNAMPGDAKLYAIPSDEPDGHVAGITLLSEFAGPSDADKPYTYSLNRVMSEGIAEDPTQAVHDDDLAVRDVDYRSMGATGDLARANFAVTPLMEPLAAGYSTVAALPSRRTEHFTASPDTAWGHFALIDPEGSSGYHEVQRFSGAMSAGEQELAWLSAPVSVGVPAETDWTAVAVRLPQDGDDSTPELLLRPPLFDSADPAETMGSWELAGKSSISKDGQKLATGEDGTVVWASLPEGDSGRYTASFEAERDAPWTPLGTRSTAVWEFDSAPVDAVTPLSLSAVAFDAAGVTDGFAERSAEQDVTLDFTTGGGAEDRSCESMTFEVSYDDGETWSKVDIDRDGDHATATLNHPADAKFVSVRFSAEDDKGQTVTTSTIRSYGLK